MQLISLCLVFGHQKMICYCGFHVHIEPNATNHQPTVNRYINQYTVSHLEAQRQMTQKILGLCWRFIFLSWYLWHPHVFYNMSLFIHTSALYISLRYCAAICYSFFACFWICSAWIVYFYDVAHAIRMSSWIINHSMCPFLFIPPRCIF